MILIENFIKIDNRYIDLSIFSIITIELNHQIETYYLDEDGADRVLNNRINELIDSGTKYTCGNYLGGITNLTVYDGKYIIALITNSTKEKLIVPGLYDSYESAEADVANIIKAKNKRTEITL